MQWNLKKTQFEKSLPKQAVFCLCGVTKGVISINRPTRTFIITFIIIIFRLYKYADEM